MILKHTLSECKTWQQNMVAIGSVVFVLSFTSIFLNFFKTNFWKDKIYTWSPNYWKAFISYNMVALYIHMKAYRYPIFVFLFVSHVQVEVWPLISLIQSGGLWWNLQNHLLILWTVCVPSYRKSIRRHPGLHFWQVGLRNWEISGLISDNNTTGTWDSLVSRFLIWSCNFFSFSSREGTTLSVENSMSTH